MRAGGDDSGGVADSAQGVCSVDVDVGVEYVQGCPRSHAARLVVQVSPAFRWAGCGRSALSGLHLRLGHVACARRVADAAQCKQPCRLGVAAMIATSGPADAQSCGCASCMACYMQRI